MCQRDSAYIGKLLDKMDVDQPRITQSAYENDLADHNQLACSFYGSEITFSPDRYPVLMVTLLIGRKQPGKGRVFVVFVVVVAFSPGALKTACYLNFYGPVHTALYVLFSH